MLNTTASVRVELESVAVDERDRPAVDEPRPRVVLPPEIAATILAVSSVLLGALLDVPTFGIFLGWAAAALATTSRATRMSTLATCLMVGALFGTGTIAGASALGAILGTAVPLWVSTILVLAVANPLMILLGRSTAFNAVPGMFIGFSTVLAVHLIEAAPISGNVLGALLVGAATNLIGLGFHWLNGRMTGRPQAAKPGSMPADHTLMK